MKRLDKNLNLLSFITILIVVLWLLGIVTYIVVYQDKILIAILSSFSTLFVQQYIENSKNKKKQQELAKLTIILIESRIAVFSPLLMDVILSGENSTKASSHNIKEFVAQIKPDETYDSIVKDISTFPQNISRSFTGYNIVFKTVRNLLENEIAQNLEQILDEPEVLENLTYLIIWNIVQGRIITMLLSQQIFNDKNQFEADKSFLVKEYWRAKDAIKNGKSRNGIVDSIVAVFKELRLSNELQVRPLLENQQDTKTSSSN